VNSLQTATAAATLSAGGVGGDGSDILNATNLQTGTGQGAKSGLGTRAGGLGAGTTGGTKLDVASGDAELLAADGDVLGGKHRGVRGGLITIGLDLHAAGDANHSFAAGEIGDVDESVIERREDVSDSENLFTVVHGGTEGDGLDGLFLGSHVEDFWG